jgi:hypothetical protein
MTTANDVLKAIKDDGIDFVDLSFTDLRPAQPRSAEPAR